jgi:hypothetical protein
MASQAAVVQMKASVPARPRRALALAVAGGLALSGSAAAAQPFVTKIIDDAPGSAECVDPLGLANPSPDVNNMPQAEVQIAVSNGGQLAAVAKDYRYGPIDDTTYNARVWNALYLSDDAGQSWRNQLFEESNPNIGITGVTGTDFGQQPGQAIRLSLETDPVAEFDRDGNLYTCALAYDRDPSGQLPSSPSAIAVSRLTPEGRVVPGTSHLLGLEADPQLFNDKNWLAVDRTEPVESTVVVASWRLFTYGDAPPAVEGGYVAVSADGAASFGSPIRLPIPLDTAPWSQFYQPLLGPDPETGRKTLYVVFRTIRDDQSLAMHLIKADIDGLAPGTSALHEHLANPQSWSYLPDRISGEHAFGSAGLGGAFRFDSYFMPAHDLATGMLYAVTHAFDDTTLLPRVVVVRSADGGVGWTSPRQVSPCEAGYQIMPTLAVHSGTVSVVWYDTRHDPAFAWLSPIRGLDVYYADLDAELGVERVLRLTPETQRADHPVFTQRSALATSLSERRLMPHDWAPPGVPRPHDQVPGGLCSAATPDGCVPYGFIGDYIGLAADGHYAYAAWCDLRDLVIDTDICAGHSCNGRRNQNIYFARIAKD